MDGLDTTRPEGQALRYVGKSPRRGDLIDKVTGKLIYGTDFSLPGMLHGKALRSPYPHARIVSIDVERARQLPGVCAAITSADLPDQRFGSSIQDEPFLARGKVRYAGEPVAAVAAINKDIARKAIDLIDVEYEELPGVYNAVEAMQPDSILVHEDLGEYAMEGFYNRISGTNIVGHTRIRRGDVEQGFADSDEVYEDVFTTQNIQHCSMEPHVGIAKVDEDGSVTVWTSCQSPYNALRDMANALELPQNKVRIICTEVGGGFGGKNYLRIEPLVVALASHTNGRPVKLAFTRDEEFIASVCKHPVHLTFRTGVKRDGTIVARKIEAVFDTGGYADTGPLVARNGAFSGTGPYRIPHVCVDSYCVYTNNPLGGSFRGFGVPQLTWAHESQMDMIATRLGIDPVEIRMRNLYNLGDKTCTGEVLRTSVGVKDSLRMAVDLSERDMRHEPSDNRKVVRGRGIATMHKLTNTPSTSSVIVKMHTDGTVNVLCSTVELGQGIYTALRQIVAERLELPMDHVRMRSPDTDYTPFDQSTSGSRSVFHAGNALIRAADDLTGKLCRMAAPLLGAPVESLVYREGAVCKKDSNAFMTADEIIKGHFGPRGATVQGEGTFTPPSAKPPDKETGQTPKMSAFWMYATQIADVEVDVETGRVKILRIVAAHDAGTIINPEGAEGQIVGGVVQGLGTTLCEQMHVSEGVITNPTFVDYKLPTTMDIPEIVTGFVDTFHEEGPFGAKGLSEPALAPTSAAVANAIYNAVGARITSLPITAEKVLNALNGARA